VDQHGLDPNGRRAGAHHVERLGMRVSVDQDAVRLRRTGTPHHHDGLRNGGRLIQQRGVSERQPRQISNHRLKVEQRL
jgi:hypothetical protein